MNAQAELTPATGTNEIVITRVFNAPLELFWRVWTEDKHMEAWFGPKGFSTRVEQNDFRVGGKWRYVMVGPDGTEYPCHGVFREIVPMAKIVTSDEFDDDFKLENGAELPQGIVPTVLFDRLGENQTRLTIRISHPTPEDKRRHEDMGVVGGWNSSLDCLEEELEAAKKLYATSGGGNAVTANNADDEAAVRKLIDEWTAAFEAKDLDKMMANYAPGVVLYDCIPPFEVVGPAAIRKSWESCLPYFPDQFKSERRDLHLFVNGDVAFFFGLHHVKPISDPKNRCGETWLRITVGYQKIAGQWKVVHEHVSVPFDPHTNQVVLITDDDVAAQTV